MSFVNADLNNQQCVEDNAKVIQSHPITLGLKLILGLYTIKQQLREILRQSNRRINCNVTVVITLYNAI